MIPFRKYWTDFLSTFELKPSLPHPIPGFPLPRIENPEPELESVREPEADQGCDVWAQSRHLQSTQFDFVDYRTGCDGKIRFFMGSVSGQGIEAQLYQTACWSLLEHLISLELDPLAIVKELNCDLASRQDEYRSASLVLGELDLATGWVKLVSAGHLRPWIKTEEGCGPVYGPRSLPVGVKADFAFEDVTFGMQPGDCLLLFGEGFLRARDAQRRAFSDTYLRQALDGCRGADSKSIVSYLLRESARCNSRITRDRSCLALVYSGVTAEASRAWAKAA